MKTILLLLTLFLSAGSSLAQTSLAPDGRRGFGARTELADLLTYFRRPADDDEVFLAELRDLEPAVGALEASVLVLVRERGYFGLLDRRHDGDLDELRARFEAFLVDPEPILIRGDRTARTWAHLLYDTRLRVRFELLADWRRDAEEVRRGLAVLKANTDGWVRIEEEQAQNVAARVDLAASLLRACVKDLSALHESPSEPSEAVAEDIEALLAALQRPPGTERQSFLDEEMRRTQRAVDGMRELLFSERLKAEANEWIQWRAELDRRAANERAEVRVWQPQTPEGKKAPKEIQKVKKTARRRQAFGHALSGLGFDPLDDELAYAAGLMAQYISGRIESVSHFDRFLALRGIRVNDDRTWRKRDLNEEENNALFYIQQFEREADRPPDRE